MSLSNFATLAEAQAFELITDKLQVGSGQARGFLVSEGIWTTLRQIQGDITNPLFALADAVIVTASDASSYFGLDTTTAEGVGNLAAANTMVATGLMTEAQKISLLALALKSTYPHATATQEDFDEANDAGEVIALPSVNGQHSIRVNTTVQPRKETTLIIEHRFGTDATNLTGWHKLGSVINIYYPTALKGAPYESGQMPATKAAYREIRLVSPLTLGVSIA
jgi:hypothetical protein